MNLIKTYKHVHRLEPEVQFRLSRMEDIWEERQGTTDEPHRHDYYTVLLVRKARAKHIIDFYEFKMKEQQVFFVSPGQVHQVIEEEKSFGYVFVFSTDFLSLNNIPQDFVDDLNLFNDHGFTPPLTINAGEMTNLSGYCEQMAQLYENPVKFGEKALGSLLQLFLIRCNNLCTLSIDNTQIRESGNSILKQFKQLVNENYHRWHQSSDYAAELHVTPDHLNRVIKSLTGKTAKEFIQSRILVASKRSLYFSEESLKEISYQLGFAEPAHFSTFFKKATGQSPSSFRTKA